jgi:surfeit locus 1 family protein
VKPRTLIVGVGLAVLAVVCVKMGFWQLSRLYEKRELSAAMRRALLIPPADLEAIARADTGVIATAEARAPGRPPAWLRARRVFASGKYDPAHQILLSGLERSGAPGVHVVTPLVLANGSAVLVDRGWLPASDGVTARPQDYPEGGERTVIGLADTLPGSAPASAWRVIESDSVTVWSARLVALDTASARLPYRLLPALVHELPRATLPPLPARSAPEPPNEMMHASYAAQWFLFAIILLVGPPWLMMSRRKEHKP